MGKTAIQLEFSIFGRMLEPELFSKLIKINASEYWCEGDIVKNKPTLKRKETAWNYTINFIETLDIEDCTYRFVEIFSNKSKAISQYCTQYNLSTKIDFVIEVWNEENPSVFFDRSFLRLVNILNAEIDIDLYYYSGS